nr:alpha/beta fold hydrolase [Plantactinospora sp. KBS50]
MTPAGSQPASPAPAGRPFAVAVDGHRVVGESWGSGPVVYLLHGWAGRSRQLASLVTPLVERGHRVVAFDAPSHGRSAPGRYGPRSSSIPEFAASLAAVAQMHGRPHAVVAHSLGATAAAVALCDGLPADRVVLLAPMASPASYAEQLRGALGFGRRILCRLTVRVERRVGAPMRHFDVPEIGRAVAVPGAGRARPGRRRGAVRRRRRDRRRLDRGDPAGDRRARPSPVVARPGGDRRGGGLRGRSRSVSRSGKAVAMGAIPDYIDMG